MRSKGALMISEEEVIKKKNIEIDIKDVLGPIVPVGETNEDNKRIDNIEKYNLIICYLLEEISEAATYKDDELNLKSKVGGEAFKLLCDLKAEIEEHINLLIVEE